MKFLEIATSLQNLGLILLNKVFQIGLDSVVSIPKYIHIAKIMHRIQFHKVSKNMRSKILKTKFGFSHISRLCSYLCQLHATVFSEYVNSYSKNFRILHTPCENAKTQLTLIPGVPWNTLKFATQ